jgi:predicted 3-demethylubiquinone-9 3-methyltransferase (glyoxalase superfamily)
MASGIATFLMFTGKAEEAAKFYISLFDDSALLTLEHYGAGEPGVEGSVKRATFRLAGQSYMAIDSSVKHAFDFTPSISLFVDCDSEAEIDRLFAALSDGGQALMPLGNYDFSRKFGWLNDRYGVSWQLTLA